MQRILIPVIFLYANSSMARTAISVAKRVESQSAKLGFQIGMIGLVIAGIFYALGKHDANEKLIKAVTGIGIISLVSVIATTIKTWMG